MRLPTYAGTLEPYAPSGDPLTPRPPRVPLTRTAFAAAHVVSDPVAERDPWVGRPAVDWENTLGFRRWLWDQGLGLAEAMDTAQRGMGVDWPTAKELIERAMREAKAHPLEPRVACGAGTDQRAPGEIRDEAGLIAAYSEQMEAIEAAGGQVILMAAARLPPSAPSADDYARVYGRAAASRPRPGDPALARRHVRPGARGLLGLERCRRRLGHRAARIIERQRRQGRRHQDLAARRAVRSAFRARLPDGVRIYTGDDFNYAELIAGDGKRHCHALLGTFTAIAPAAVQALRGAGRRATSRLTTRSSRRPSRSAARSSRRRPGTTRPASPSSPG